MDCLPPLPLPPPSKDATELKSKPFDFLELPMTVANNANLPNCAWELPLLLLVKVLIKVLPIPREPCSPLPLPPSWPLPTTYSATLRIKRSIADICSSDGSDLAAVVSLETASP